MRNVNSAGFLGLLLLGAAFSSGLFYLKDRYGGGGHPPWLAWLGLVGIVIWLILLIAVSVSYVRRENKLRDSYWSVERTPVRLTNVYFRQVILVFSAPLLFGVIAGILWPSLSERAILPCFSFPFFILVAFIFASVILYLHEEERISEAAYLDFARQLGVGAEALEAVRDRLRRSENRESDPWAQACVTYRDHHILFIGEHMGRIPCFVLSLETPAQTRYSCSQLAGQMREEVKGLFSRIQSRAKKVDLWCADGRVFFRVPLISRSLTVDLLRDAMDVLIEVARIEEGRITP